MELQDAKHRLGIFHNMVRDSEALRSENDKFRTYIIELWTDIKRMKLGTILAIAKTRQYESEFDCILEEWNQNSKVRSLLLTSWPLEETMYRSEWATDVYQARCILCQNPFGPEGCFTMGSCGAQFYPPCLILCMIKKQSCPHCWSPFHP